MKEKSNKRDDIALLDDVFLSSAELGQLLGLSPNAIRIQLSRQTFPLKPIRVGSRLRWRASRVQRWIEDQERNAGVS